jgi:hypothetical protein
MTRGGSPERDVAANHRPLPPRPASVELAAAILIVAGIVGFVTAAGAWFSGSVDPFLWLALGLNAGSIGLGIATRLGRLWLLTLNFAAVLAFLDILGSATSPVPLMIGITEVVVVVILLLRKPWFDAVARARAAPAETGAYPEPGR